LPHCIWSKCKVSLQGVDSLWGDCTFIPVDWGPRGHSSRFVLFCSFWRLFTKKMIKSISIFFLKNNNNFFFLLHKIQTPGINMQNGRQVI
jgi:hypothetical protein